SGRHPRWRGVVGVAFAGLGTAGWTALVVLPDPPTGSDLLAASLGSSPARDARWAAGLLAVGGLLLLASSVGRRLAVLAVALGWATADLALDSGPHPEWVVTAVVAAVVAALVVVLGRDASTSRPVGP